MTSLTCGVDVLLRAAQFIEEQALGQPTYQTSVLESPQLSTGKPWIMIKIIKSALQSSSAQPYRICAVFFSWKPLHYLRCPRWMKLKCKKTTVVCMENRAITLHSRSISLSPSLSHHGFFQSVVQSFFFFFSPNSKALLYVV